MRPPQEWEDKPPPTGSFEPDVAALLHPSLLLLQRPASADASCLHQSLIQVIYRWAFSWHPLSALTKFSALTFTRSCCVVRVTITESIMHSTVSCVPVPQVSSFLILIYYPAQRMDGSAFSPGFCAVELHKINMLICWGFGRSCSFLPQQIQESISTPPKRVVSPL
jgi:hypothetical protein